MLIESERKEKKMYRIFKIEDEIMIELCLLYCEGKSYLWNLFYGWRQTYKNTYYFKFTEKQWRRILETVNHIDNYMYLKKEN